MDILEKAKKFPLKPGIYRFIGKNKKILYVGKAGYLKRRILNYFRSGIDPRIGEMVSLAVDLEFETTDTVLDAVILEANEIKKYWPKYNIKDKDGRSFIYVLIDKKEDFPKPLVFRGQELKKFPIAKAKGRYAVFGPYQGVSLINNALRIIRRIFPYSLCRANSDRACFDYQIGLCPGVCVNAVSKEAYRKNIDNIILLLSGEKKKLIKQLKKENPEKELSLKHIADSALITADSGVFGPSRIEGYDISHLSGKETFGSMVVFSNGKPDKTQYRLFKIKEAPKNDDLRSLEEMLGRRLKHQEWRFPNIIMIDGGKPQIDFLSKLMKARRVNVPIVGISKFGGDKLVFEKGANDSFKKLAEGMKDILLAVRDEAHRFALKSSRRERRAPIRKGLKSIV